MWALVIVMWLSGRSASLMLNRSLLEVFECKFIFVEYSKTEDEHLIDVFLQVRKLTIIGARLKNFSVK